MPKNTVFAGSVEHQPTIVEARAAAGNIRPGQLVTRTAGQFALTANAQPGALYIADLNSMRQGGIDELYASGDTVKAFYPKAGELFHVRSAVANYTAVDTPLTCNAAGQVRIALTNGTEEIVAYVDEVINVTVADSLVRVRMANYSRQA
jgi:hypothetical protein